MLRSSSSARISPAAAPAESCVRTRRTAWSERMCGRVFDGLKVIDCASFIAGPAAATVMSDFGAAVIKIEPPGMGDPYRRRAVPPIGPGIAQNPGFVLDGRNKRSLALDLRRPEGQRVLRR